MEENGWDLQKQEEPGKGSGKGGHSRVRGLGQGAHVDGFVHLGVRSLAQFFPRHVALSDLLGFFEPQCPDL